MSYPVGGGPAWGINLTNVPAGKSAEHFVGQLMPAGIEMRLPFSAPVITTVRRYFSKVDAEGEALSEEAGDSDALADSDGVGDVFAIGGVDRGAKSAAIRSAAHAIAMPVAILRTKLVFIASVYLTRSSAMQTP
jgi:hypothetical protein